MTASTERRSASLYGLVLAVAAVFAAPIAPAPAELAAQALVTPADLLKLNVAPPDHRIAYGTDPLQFGNLRLPKGAGPYPVVLFIHGGCWLKQFDIAHAAAFEQAMADSGFAVWSIEYRVGDPGGGWPNTFRDIGSGADYLRVLKHTYPLDLNRVIVAGHSAGGQFALWVAARKKIARTSALYTADPIRVRGVFALAAAPDLEALDSAVACGGAVDKVMGGSPAEHPDRYAAASPMQLAPVDVPEVLIVGAKDKTWGPHGRAYAAHARAVGDTTLTLIEAPESGHFELIAPATSTWPLVIGNLKMMFARMKP